MSLVKVKRQNTGILGPDIEIEREIRRRCREEGVTLNFFLRRLLGMPPPRPRGWPKGKPRKKKPKVSA